MRKGAGPKILVQFGSPFPAYTTLSSILINEMERYLTLRLPVGLAPTEATIGGYTHDRSVRSLHRVESVEATF